MQTILMWAAIIFLLDLLLIAFVRGADERREGKQEGWNGAGSSAQRARSS